MDIYAMWLGYAVMVIASIAAFVALAWFCLDVVVRRTRWFTTLLEWRREWIRERRGLGN